MNQVCQERDYYINGDNDNIFQVENSNDIMLNKNFPHTFILTFYTLYFL